MVHQLLFLLSFLTFSHGQLVNYFAVDPFNIIDDTLKPFDFKLNVWPSQCNTYDPIQLTLSSTGLIFSVDRNGILSNETDTTIQYTSSGITAFNSFRKVFLSTPTVTDMSQHNRQVPVSLLMQVKCGSNHFDVEEINLTRTIIVNNGVYTEGDPHYMSLKGRYFDWHQPGIYNLLESDDLLIQNYQNWCVENWVGCNNAFAILYGDELVRFHATGTAVRVTRGSNKLEKLVVTRNAHNTAFRVFINGNLNEIIDITSWGNRWVNIYPRLPTFMTGKAKGLLSYSGGDLSSFGNAQRVPLMASLFNCAGEDECSPHFLQAVTFTSGNTNSPSLTSQGFTRIPTSSIPAEKPILLGASGFRKRTAEEAAPEVIKQEAEKLCAQVIRDFPECVKLLGEDYTNSVIKSCVTDVTIISKGLFDDIEGKKTGFLSECRSTIESDIQANILTDLSEINKMNNLRKTLGFGDKECLSTCQNGGTCTETGCSCAQGFSGASCEVNINVNANIIDCTVNGCTCRAGFTGDLCQTQA
jgi:hypothetical protein